MNLVNTNYGKQLEKSLLIMTIIHILGNLYTNKGSENILFMQKKIGQLIQQIWENYVDTSNKTIKAMWLPDVYLETK